MKQLILKMSALGFGVLLFFIITEVALRFLGFPASDIFTRDAQSGLLLLNQNKKIRIVSECFDNTIVTNSLGFHSKEYTLEKPPGTYRIAILGDSFIEAQQVLLEKTITTKLEEKLNALPNRSVRYEVIPFGISSHGTWQNILYTHRFALQFKPDLVIDAFVMNDPEDDMFDGTPVFQEDGTLKVEPVVVPESSPSIKQVKKVLRKSVLVTTVRKKYQLFKSQWNEKEEDASIPNEVGILMSEYTDFWKNAWKREDQLLGAFKKMTDKYGAKFTVVSLTNGYRVHPELIAEFEKFTKDVAVDFDKPEKVLQGITQTRAIPYLALTQIFREKAKTTKDTTVWSCDGHWNELGHEWGAQALSEFLISQQLLQ